MFCGAGMWLWAPASGLLEGGLDRRSRTDGVEVDEVVSNSINPSSARRCWELRQHHCIEPEGNAVRYNVCDYLLHLMKAGIKSGFAEQS